MKRKEMVDLMAKAISKMDTELGGLFGAIKDEWATKYAEAALEAQEQAGIEWEFEDES